ncbi:MAG: hypothetical protein ACKOA9_03955, partial [Actinomycetota bacterium]
EVPDIVAAIERATDLDERQKQALVDVYRSMRRAPAADLPADLPADPPADPPGSREDGPPVGP